MAIYSNNKLYQFIAMLYFLFSPLALRSLASVQKQGRGIAAANTDDNS